MIALAVIEGVILDEKHTVDIALVFVGDIFDIATLIDRQGGRP